jgi:undecaprenyl-diphosphatase
MMLQNIDVFLFQFVNQTLRNPVFDSVMPLISQYGYYTWVGLVGLVLAFDKRSGFNNARLLLTSLLAGWVATEEVLKPLFHRSRPYLSGLGSQVHTLLPLQTNASFPSGAAVISFATVVPFVICYRQSRTRFLAIAWALLIMFSRVYVGAHYPSDVIAGFVFGSTVGLILVWFNLATQNQEHHNRNRPLKEHVDD